jgi:hypothetical protein
MRQLNFRKPAAIRFDDVFLTDHNRSAIDINYERIQDTVRTQFGQLRKYHRADKRTFSFSWSMLPETFRHTVDGNPGAKELENLFLNFTGSFLMTLSYDEGSEEEIEVIITDFSVSLEKRWDPTNFYSVSISLEEV